MLRGCRMLLAGLVVMAMTCASVAEDDWSLSKLVPFKKSSTSKRTHASVSDAGRSTGLPKMSLPTWSKKKGTPAKSSAWNKLTKNTQNMLEKTKDALTPGDQSSKKHKGRNKSSSSSWFGSWFKSKPKPKAKRSETLPEWLGRPFVWW